MENEGVSLMQTVRQERKNKGRREGVQITTEILRHSLKDQSLWFHKQQRPLKGNSDVVPGSTKYRGEAYG